MRLLLLTPPLVQLNTPYPATVYLTGHLRSRGYDVRQADPGLTWVLRLLSPAGLGRLVEALRAVPAKKRTPPMAHVVQHAESLSAVMPAVLQLLQERDSSLVHRIAARRFLPEGPRFATLGPSGHEGEYLDWAFGQLGTADRARYLATLFVEDVADALRDGVDPAFSFSKYGDSLAQSQPTLDPLLAALAERPYTVELLETVMDELLAEHQPDVVGMTIPFPGNVLGALRLARHIKATRPAIRVVWGGGYVNTELRKLSDPRLFDLVDAVTYDDGERPLECLLEHWSGKRGAEQLLRTRVRRGGVVEWVSDARERDVPFAESGAPTYDGLPLADYLRLFDMLNPMHRLWSDTRWNKLTIAHGCYWKKCTFCDISLDYIGNYAPLAAQKLADRMEALVAETGSRGFHFVDEAAPPAGLKALAEEILRRNLVVSFWGNIRFEKSFNKKLCELLAKAGCVAVSGGLEVASDRLLGLMQKGVSVEQVARVARDFNAAGIRVHAYLMYGFPSETEQETIDALERVRQLFANGCLDSAFWHRFSLTAHAPIAADPAAYGLKVAPRPVVTFGENDLPFTDTTSVDHSRLGPGLERALYNYMHGLGLDEDVRSWFAHRAPKPTVGKDLIAKALRV